VQARTRTESVQATFTERPRPGKHAYDSCNSRFSLEVRLSEFQKFLPGLHPLLAGDEQTGSHSGPEVRFWEVNRRQLPGPSRPTRKPALAPRVVNGQERQTYRSLRQRENRPRAHFRRQFCRIYATPLGDSPGRPDTHP
jgi:hypothetical protein